jgi:hypothetical protein
MPEFVKRKRKITDFSSLYQRIVGLAFEVDEKTSKFKVDF